VKSIRGRVVIALIIVMIFTVSVTVLLFVRLINVILIDQAKTQLQIQMEKAIEILNGGNLTDLDETDLALNFKNRMFYADFFITDRNDKVLAASKTEKIGSKLEVSFTKKQGIMQLDHQQMMYSHENLIDKNNLRLVVYTPLSSVHSILGKLINVTLIAFGVSILFIFSIGMLIIWNTTRPLKKLKDAISLYEPYRKASVFPKADSTEIGELIDTFQIMSERINKHHNHQIEFLQNVSHELRTPLMSIQGYTMAIKDQVVTVDQGLQVITKESQRLIQMVERLLQLSRLETVEEVWTESLIDLNNMAEQAIELLTPVANESNIQISVEGIPLEVYLPAEEIFQVIVNLLQNAIKYAKSEVILRIEGTLSEGIHIKTWAFHIDDDGAGLTEEQRAYVFQRFYKGENGGTGLGLAICQQIADRLGAHLDCMVSPKGGARFSFWKEYL
jgi:signal transduction histidine kinase